VATTTERANWSALVERIKGYKAPNVKAARTAIEQFDLDGHGLEEDVLSALVSYEEVERDNYESTQEYREAREEAWDSFLEALDDAAEALEQNDEAESEPSSDEAAEAVQAEIESLRKENAELARKASKAVPEAVAEADDEPDSEPRRSGQSDAWPPRRCRGRRVEAD